MWPSAEVDRQAPPLSGLHWTGQAKEVRQALLTFATVVVVILDIVIIATVAMQTTKQEGLSGVIGGSSSSHFRRGGWDDLLERVTKYTAVVWAVFAAVNAWLWYNMWSV